MKSPFFILSICFLVLYPGFALSHGDMECEGGDIGCIVACESSVQWLGEPQETTVEVVSTECTWSGDVCICRGPSGTGYNMLDMRWSEGECLRYSRACHCIYSKTDFGGCDTAEPDTSCDAVCADYIQRIKDDYAATYTAKVHDAFCDHIDQCACIIEMEGRCYIWSIGGGCVRHAFDCSKPAEEMWYNYLCDASFCPVRNGEDGICGCGAAGENASAIFLLGTLIWLCRVLIQRRRARSTALHID